MGGLDLYISGPDLDLTLALLAAYVAGACSVVLVALVWLARRCGVTWTEVVEMWKS